jgi:hypothetical protein
MASILVFRVGDFCPGVIFWNGLLLCVFCFTGAGVSSLGVLSGLGLTGSSLDTLLMDNEDGKFKFSITVCFLFVANGGLASSNTCCTDTEDGKLIKAGRGDVSATPGSTFSTVWVCSSWSVGLIAPP